MESYFVNKILNAHVNFFYYKYIVEYIVENYIYIINNHII